MSLYLVDNPSVVQVSTDAVTLPEPAGAQDGEMQLILQGGSIGTFDPPAGWKEIFSNGAMSFHWGIRGVDFAGGNASMVSGSAGRGTILARYRVTGNVDETCVFSHNQRGWTDGTLDYFYANSLTVVDAENRSRLYLSMARQTASDGVMVSFDGRGAGFADAFNLNLWEDSPSDPGGCGFGLAFSEDNAAIWPNVPTNRFYGYQPATGTMRVECVNLYIVEAEKKQTDILTPPPVF